MRIKIFVSIFLSLSFLLPTNLQAQDKLYGDPLKDVTIVGAAAAFGAILGLSTLPFTEEPGDHMKNVLVGGAVGLILGVAWVAYSQAKTTNQGYAYALNTETPKEYGGAERAKILTDISSKNIASRPSKLTSVGYTFSF